MEGALDYRTYLFAEKKVRMRTTRYPNPIVRNGTDVWVVIQFRDGGERTRFVVDEADYEELIAPYRWNASSVTSERIYTSAAIPSGTGNSTVLVHRWLFNPEVEDEVDHIDGNPLNNRRKNLRPVTRKQNEENYHARKDTTTSLKRGVYLDGGTGRWRASVMHNRRTHHSPRFDTEEAADAWAIQKRAELFTHSTT